jgi:hypothetical protein
LLDYDGVFVPSIVHKLQRQTFLGVVYKLLVALSRSIEGANRNPI